MARGIVGWTCIIGLLSIGPAGICATPYYPASEADGGWRSLVKVGVTPDNEQLRAIKLLCRIDGSKLAEAWDYASQIPGKSGLLVIRDGYIVGEWYKDCGPTDRFETYSVSKTYTSAAYGLLFRGADYTKTKIAVTPDTPLFDPQLLPEAFPLSDPRMANVTVGQALRMTSGMPEGNVPALRPLEWVLGKVDGSPYTKLEAEPGEHWAYSNASSAVLSLFFSRATGESLHDYLETRLFPVIGMGETRWKQMGGHQGSIGPIEQGYSGLSVTPRDHARFLHLALHRGIWNGQTVLEEAYFQFAWAPMQPEPRYGAQWWLSGHLSGVPEDTVMTEGLMNNVGYLIPSERLIVVRFGDGRPPPVRFNQELIIKVLAAIE